MTVGAGPPQGKDIPKTTHRLELAMLEVLIELRG